jgi:hypothetical protein
MVLIGEFLESVTVKVTIFHDMTPSCLVNLNSCFRFLVFSLNYERLAELASIFRAALIKNAGGYSEVSAHICQPHCMVLHKK